MTTLFDILFQLVFGPCTLFVGHPENGLLMAMSFAILLVVSILRSKEIMTLTHLLLLASAGLWVGYVWWEFHAQQQGWNIRVDILCIWPVLLLISMAAAWRGIRSVAFSKHQEPINDKGVGDPSPRTDSLD